MPTMIRPKGKAKKIAYSILGVPDNIAQDKTDKNKKIRKELLIEETQKVR